MSKWMVYNKKADFKEIGDRLGVDQVVVRIARNRGVTTDEEFDRYFSENYDSLHDPARLKDSERAVDILINKISEGKHIRIVGDYDIDGVCSTVILYKSLGAAGANVDYRVPDRVKDGYGINNLIIEEAASAGVDTIITCDNGIAAKEQIDYAKTLGMTVIVTDHHDIPFEVGADGAIRYILPAADAVVNPKQTDCDYPFKLLCGASVAYLLMCLMYRKLFGVVSSELRAAMGDAVRNDIRLEGVLDECRQLAAIATVGDIVDLIDENRQIVRYGLSTMKDTANIGIKSLAEVCEIELSLLDAYHIGFILGPCINASGRLETANKAIRLLLETNKAQARELALELKELNDKRKTLTEEQCLKAYDIIENSELIDDLCLVVYLPECHESIAGIIAGRIKERYYRPTIVLTDGEEGAKGSARSIEGYNIFEELTACKELLTRFGGHPMAAGMSLPKENIDALREKLNQDLIYDEKVFTPVSWIDVPMPLSYVSLRVINQLHRLEPFGKGNEKPMFADKNLVVKRAEIVGKNKNVLKLSLMDGNGMLYDAIKFNASADEMPVVGQTIMILYYPRINEFMNKVSIQFNIVEWM